MPRYKVLRSFAPLHRPTLAEGEEVELPAAEAEGYAPHVERLAEPKKKAKKAAAKSPAKKGT